MAVIDTGAEVTVISTQLYNSIPFHERPLLRRSPRNLRMADFNQNMITSGVIVANLKLGNTTIEWPVYVASIKDQILLGCDIFDALDLTLTSKGGLKVKGQWIECEVIRKPSNVSRIRLKEGIAIPSNSKIIALGRIENQHALGARFGLAEPCVNLNPENDSECSLTIARAIIDTHAANIPVRLLNISNNPVIVPSGYLLGEVTRIESLVELDLNEGKECSLEGTHGIEVRRASFFNRNSEDGDTQMPVIPPAFHPVSPIPGEDQGDSSCASGKATDSFDSGTIDGLNKEDNSSDMDGIQAGDSDIPIHSEELFNSSSSLLNGQQRNKLKCLLQKHESTFAKSKLELGNTGLATPIHQAMRRTPKGF